MLIMHIINRLFVIVGVFIMALSGCRQVNHYGFKIVEQSLLDGNLSILVNGRYGEEYKKDNEDYLDWASPYYIQFTYSVAPERVLNKIVIKNITLEGSEAGKSHVLADIDTDDFRVYEDRALFRKSAGPLTVDEYEYQDYVLKATVVVYRTETDFEEKEIEVLLKTEYRKERRSDWFDEKMSV